MGRVRAMPRLCKLYPGICLTTEKKEWKNLSQGLLVFSSAVVFPLNTLGCVCMCMCVYRQVCVHNHNNCPPTHDGAGWCSGNCLFSRNAG